MSPEWCWLAKMADVASGLQQASLPVQQCSSTVQCRLSARSTCMHARSTPVPLSTPVPRLPAALPCPTHRPGWAGSMPGHVCHEHGLRSRLAVDAAGATTISLVMAALAHGCVPSALKLTGHHICMAAACPLHHTYHTCGAACLDGCACWHARKSCLDGLYQASGSQD